MDWTDRIERASAVVLVLIMTVSSDRAGAQEFGRWGAREVAAAPNRADEAILGRPIALALAGNILYIADAQDCAVKLFSRDGQFLTAFGRKGGGPGELSFPSGICAAGGRIYVADKLNRRIQSFEGDGRSCDIFPVPFAPDRILALDADTLLVTQNPTGRGAAEPLLHIYDTAGRPRWEGLEARASSDPVFDTLRNMILTCPGEQGDFYVVFRSGDRTILRFAATGTLLGRITVDPRHAFMALDLPFRGPTKRLLGFCWAAARDRGFLYLAAPERVERGDLGPGRRLSVIDGEGRLRAVIDLPRPVHRFVVDDGRIFAIDEEGELRIFEVVR